MDELTIKRRTKISVLTSIIQNIKFHGLQKSLAQMEKDLKKLQGIENATSKSKV